MQQRGPTGILGEGTAYRDSKVPDKLMGPLRHSLRVHLLPGEELLGLFAAWRLRRPITTLVVTDLRLLTLGEVDKGLPVVDEVDRAAVTDLHVERTKLLSSGRVSAETHLGSISLGTLDYAGDGSTFLGLDEVLARDVSDAGLPVIPVPGPVDAAGQTGAPGQQGPAGPADTPVLSGPQDGPPVEDVSPDGRGHPLITHLTALADLHERGALTDEEFTAAKARLLQSPPD